MTDSHDPNQLDPLDDLASAHLDGQTTAAEAAQVAGDPKLAARVAELAAVRAALQSDQPPVDEARREATIAVALAVFDEAGSGHAAPVDPAAVTPIAVAAARRHVSRRGVQVIGAAAVAVLLAIAVPLLGSLDSDDDSASDDVATSVLEESTAERDGGDAAGGAAEDAQAPMVAGTYSASAPVDLGEFDDLDALEAAARTYVAPLEAGAEDMATPTTTTARVAEAADACPGSPDSGVKVLSGTATLEGRPVLVFVYEDPAGTQTVVVADAADCTVISSRELD